MKPLHSLMTGTALAALVALPVSALDLDTSADFGLGVGAEATAMNPDRDEPITSAGGSTTVEAGTATQTETAEIPDDDQPVTNIGTDTTLTADTEAGATVGDTTAREPVTTVEGSYDATFEGDAVLSADAMPLGTVQSVDVAEEGTQRLHILLDPGVMADEATVVSFTIDDQLTSDGEIRLSWTKAEFEAAIAAAKG